MIEERAQAVRPSEAAAVAYTEQDQQVVQDFVGFTQQAQAALDGGTVRLSVAELDAIVRQMEDLQARLRGHAEQVAAQVDGWDRVRWGRTRSAAALVEEFREQASDQPGGAQRYLTDFALKIEIIRSWLVGARDQVLAVDQGVTDDLRSAAAQADPGRA